MSKTTEIIDLMKSHVSVREYTEELMPEKHLMEIIKAGQSASSSHFSQAYSIIRISNQEKKDKISKLSNNPQVSKSAEFLLFCGDLKRLEYAGKKNNIKIEHDSLENFIVANIDTALIAQNIILAAESLGYGGCYIGGIRNNISEISKTVELPDKVFLLFGLCLGTIAQKEQVKPRLPINAILHENTYDEYKYINLLDKYDNAMRNYYNSRTQNNKKTNWTIKMSDYMRYKKRTHLRDYMKNKGFILK